MLKSKNWIYLDLEKTGCAFLRVKFIKIYPKDYFEINREHQAPLYNYSIPRIITIREPESYYFSLWSYGLQERGGFYEIIKNFYPEKLKFFYQSASIDAFSYFLDFALNYPSKNPIRKLSRTNINKVLLNAKLLINILFERKIWLPDSCDIYTARILEMLIAKSERKFFIKNIGTDLSYKNLNSNLKQYIPEVILRTKTLNKDFYLYYQKKKLCFLNLPNNWKEIFPLDSLPLNRSKIPSNKSEFNKIENFLSPYHKDLIRHKSNLAYLLLHKAQENLTLEN